MANDLVKITDKIPNFEHLTEELRALVVETEFNARWTLLEGWHELGRILIEHGLDKREFLSLMTKELGKSERHLYRCVQFYKMFPDLDMLPEGKNTSWHRVCNKYLVGKGDEDDEDYSMPEYEVLKAYIKDNFEILADRAELLKTGIKLTIPHEVIKRYEIQKRTDN